MSTLVEARRACARSSSPLALHGAPPSVVWAPRSPVQSRPKIGMSAAPMMGEPSSRSAISVPKSGLPVIKDLVPSIGSITHWYWLSEVLTPNSSPKMPWSGNCASISSRMACSASRSARVTGESSSLRSMFSGCPKYGTTTFRETAASWWRNAIVGL